jgi:uncharacterized GH25 family protein
MSSARIVGAAVSVGLWLGVSPAIAHDTWLLPARFALPTGATVEADLTSGMAFPRLESAVAADRLVATGLRVAGRRAPLTPLRSGPAALRLSAAAAAPGVAVLWVATRPRTLSLTPGQVEEYLPEIGASESVVARWRRQKRWRETYSKLAKSFVRVGEAGADRSWDEPVGLELEIVPLDDPTALVAGSELRLRVLRSGRPLAGFAVSAVAAGAHASPVMRSTAGDGTVAFRLERPGAWLLRGTLIEESRAPDADWQSLFTTLTVSVGSRP